MKSSNDTPSTMETTPKNISNQNSAGDNKSAFFNENQQQGVHFRADVTVKPNEIHLSAEGSKPKFEPIAMGIGAGAVVVATYLAVSAFKK